MLKLEVAVQRLAEGYRENECLILDRDLADGRKVCRQRTGVVDRFLQSFLVQTSGQDEAPFPYCIVAGSGFGRMELSPNSDIEMTLIHDDRAPPDHKYIQKIADSFMYLIPWEFGHKISFHSLSETPYEETRNDAPGLGTHHSRVLMDMRMLKGDTSFFNMVKAKLIAYALANTRNFADDRLAENKAEMAKYPSDNLNPPFNIKWGRGSLSQFSRAVSLIGYQRYEPSLQVYQRIPDEVLASFGLLLKARAWLNLRNGLSSENSFSVRPGDYRTLDNFTQQDAVAFEEHFGKRSLDALYSARKTIMRYAEQIISSIKN